MEWFDVEADNNKQNDFVFESWFDKVNKIDLTSSSIYKYCQNECNNPVISSIINKFYQNILTKYRSFISIDSHYIAYEIYKLFLNENQLNIIHDLLNNDNLDYVDKIAISMVAIDTENYDLLLTLINKGFDLILNQIHYLI